MHWPVPVSFVSKSCSSNFSGPLLYSLPSVLDLSRPVFVLRSALQMRFSFLSIFDYYFSEKTYVVISKSSFFFLSFFILISPCIILYVARNCKRFI
jgi:hypothetical protein